MTNRGWDFVLQLTMACLAATLSACAVSERDSARSSPSLAISRGSTHRTGTPAPDFWQQRADYTIDASLDESTRSIAAVCTLRYTNNSPTELRELYFNLDQNLFRPNSAGAKSTPSGARFGHTGDFQGGFDIQQVLVLGQSISMHVDDTIGRIDLPTPIPPRGGTAEITITYSFRIPQNGSDRLGIEVTQDGPIFQIAQWFPNVCVYDDVHGWNTLPYLGQGEFYTDFGDYDVRLSVPRSHIVGATGELANPGEVLTPDQATRLAQARSSREPIEIISADSIASPETRPTGPGDRLTWRFLASNVRTFAWASSPAFAWDACAADAGGGRLVLCQSLYPKAASDPWSPASKGGGSSRMLRDSIEHYSRRWSPYPWTQISNVSGIVGGMEYPMMLFCDGRVGERDLWDVTTHEVSHSWFPMMVNSDERRHAWMDEGLATFMNVYATIERYGTSAGPSGEPDGPRAFADAHPRPLKQAVTTPSDDIDRDSLATIAYEKPAIALRVLRDAVLGPDRFDTALREYIRRWSFKNPQPADFFRTMEQVSGEDLGWFWSEWFDGREVLDQAVARVEDHGDRVDVIVEERGGLKMPVRVRATLIDGFTVDLEATMREWRERGDAGGSVLRLSVPVVGRDVRRIEVDPGKLLPDVEPRNNVWERAR